MRNRLREALVAIVTAVVVGGLALTTTRTAASGGRISGIAGSSHGGREA